MNFQLDGRCFCISAQNIFNSFVFFSFYAYLSNDPNSFNTVIVSISCSFRIYFLNYLSYTNRLQFPNLFCVCKRNKQYIGTFYLNYLAMFYLHFLL